jgi:hypothetical protein
MSWRRTLRNADTAPSHLLAQSPTPNNLVVAAHAGWIGPAQCVETALLAEQYARIPLDHGSTEFAAFLLRSPDAKQLRIYNYTRNADGIGRVGPLTDAVAADMASGWRMTAMLHNHNFHPGQPALNGITAPSGADAQLAQSLAENYGLQAMWITNGVDTVRIPRDAFPLLATHD